MDKCFINGLIMQIALPAAVDNINNSFNKAA